MVYLLVSLCPTPRRTGCTYHAIAVLASCHAYFLRIFEHYRAGGRHAMAGYPSCAPRLSTLVYHIRGTVSRLYVSP